MVQVMACRGSGFSVHGSPAAPEVENDGAIEDPPFAVARTQGRKRHVARESRRPRAQIAAAPVGIGTERPNDLLENGLNQIVVIGLAPAEDAIEREIDDPEQTLVQQARDALVALAYS
jgi:hypothetical protein